MLGVLCKRGPSDITARAAATGIAMEMAVLGLGGARAEAGRRGDDPEAKGRVIAADDELPRGAP